MCIRDSLKTFYFQSAYPLQLPTLPGISSSTRPDSSKTLALYKSFTYLLTVYHYRLRNRSRFYEQRSHFSSHAVKNSTKLCKQPVCVRTLNSREWKSWQFQSCTPAAWCRDFHSRVFHPYIMVPRWHGTIMQGWKMRK